MKKLITTAALTALLTLTACSQTGQPQTIVTTPSESSEVQTVTVNSTEKVTVVPDIAEIVYSIRTQGADAESCQQKNTEETDRVVALLKELGVAEGSIQTTGYYLDPRYDWSNNTQTLVGYEASTTLTVSDLPMDQVGAVLSQSVSAGVNNIQSISYLSSQYDASYQEALSLAVSAAQAKAQAMADAGGYRLGTVKSMQETSQYTEARYNDSVLQQKSASVKEMAVADVSIMPGELAIEASVAVEYFLHPLQ